MSMEENLNSLGWKVRNVPGLINRIGPLWARRRGDNWEYGLMLDESHCNSAGLIHGGIVTTLADHALSAIAWEAAERRPCVTIQLGTHFLSPIRAGSFLVAQGSVVQLGRSTLFMEGVLSVDGKKVAVASGVWKQA